MDLKIALMRQISLYGDDKIIQYILNIFNSDKQYFNTEKEEYSMKFNAGQILTQINKVDIEPNFIRYLYNSKKTDWEIKWCINKEKAYESKFLYKDQALKGLKNKSCNQLERWLYAWVLLNENQCIEELKNIICDRKENPYLRGRLITSLSEVPNRESLDACFNLYIIIKVKIGK